MNKDIVNSMLITSTSTACSERAPRTSPASGYGECVVTNFAMFVNYLYNADRVIVSVVEWTIALASAQCSEAMDLFVNSEGIQSKFHHLILMHFCAAGSPPENRHTESSS